MTQEQIRILKDKEYHQDGIVYGEGSCRSMIMSCLIYGTTKEEFMKTYAENYVKYEESWVGNNGRIRRSKDGKFNSLEEVSAIWDDQQNYFKNHVRVNHNVYTDSEGLSYNSITEF
jgi:hypothetical protein